MDAPTGPYEDYCEDKLRNINNYLQHPQLSDGQRKDLGGFYKAFCENAREGKDKAMKIPTREGYIRSIGRFGIWLKKDFRKASKTDIENYINTLNKNSNSVRDWAKLAIKVFYRWLLTGKTNKASPFPELVSWLKINYKAQTPIKQDDCLTNTEEKLLLDGCTTVRDRAFVSLLLDTGVRAGEALEIRIEDVKLEGSEPYVKIRHSKTEAKAGLREVGIVDAFQDLKAWMQQHPQKNNGKAFLFVPLRAKGKEKIRDYLTVPQMWAMITTTAKRAGIGKDVWTHLLRHTSITEAVVSGVNMPMANASYGWTGHKMFLRYGHPTGKDSAKHKRRMRGLEVATDEEKKARVCWRCQNINPWAADVCVCGAVLDATKAKKERLSLQQEMAEMRKQILEIQKKQLKERMAKS